MKALCLQLSIAVCVMISNTNLSAQLAITCPDPTDFNLECAEDVPPQAGDSLGFLSLQGASISGVTGNLYIQYSDFTRPDNSGCPGDQIYRQRTFRFTDDSNAEEIMCNIRYYIERPANADMMTCDDVTVTLDEFGGATLHPNDVPHQPTLVCPGDITITGAEITQFSCDDLAESPLKNILYAENECGEEISCGFNVTVEDETDPEITCPDNIEIDLEPCVCETVVTFDDATATDECQTEQPVDVVRTDNAGLNSGDYFPVGLTVLTFQAEDESGNTSSCNLQIRVNSSDPGSLSCNVDQNISLNEDCAAKITPQMLVTDPACDIESYEVTLFDDQGNELPSDTITAEYLGEMVTAYASYECYGNSCWVKFNVEDKMPPMINCSDMTISCSDFIDFPLPTISDNCGTFSAVLLNEVPKDVACEGTEIDRVITRTYGVRDESGDIVETCDQTLAIKKFDISEVEGPEMVVTIACDSLMDLDAQGNPDPSVTGAPTLNGIELYPQSDLMCNVAVSYDDMVFPGNGCGTSLLRTWTVVNWYCGEDGMVTFKQSITVIDTVAPVIVVPENVTISSSMTSCETSYTVPEPGLNDNCQDDIKLDIIYPGGIEFDTNSITIDLELGDNKITYRADDRCGNMSLASYTVTVEDMVQPVAICRSGISVSLDGNGKAVLTAKTFNNGSLDECSEAVAEIARMTDNCDVEGNTTFGPDVILCCEDIETEVMIILKVTDDAGNTSQCMAGVQVVDNIKPSFFSGLPDITISNDYPVDTSDLSAFGIVEQNVDFPGDIELEADVVIFDGDPVNAVVMDNCSVNEVNETSEVDINMCQTGTIVRTFIVSDAFGTADTIEQEITIIAQREFTRDDITFPKDTVIMDVCSPNLDPQHLNSYPEYDDSFSSMVSHTNEDDTLLFFSNGCFTVERVWYVSDWCNRPDGQTFSTFVDTQMITVIDNIDPEITSVCMDSTICSFVSACGPHPVNISASGTDNCTSSDSLEWTFTIAFADDRPDSMGVGSNFQGSLPVGDNVITWQVDDGCGNTADCTYTITIESCLNPQPVCVLGLEYFISPIDTSGDMNPDVNGVRVTAEMIDGGSSHPCGKDISVSFSEDVTDTVRIFTCDTLGTVPLMLFATDEDGRFDFCNVNIEVRDTSIEMYCGMGMVAGVVFGNEINFVSGVSVELEGAEMVTETDENGFFAFPEMQTGGSYRVVPTKVDNPRNGVSTADLVLIQRHILELQSFESPYKRIAADVNQSGNISASDLIAIRKLILGLSDGFPNEKTWSFIPGDHVFLDQSDPWSNPIPEQHEIYHLSGQNELDFIGVKLGDVNESVELNSMFSTERSVQQINYRMVGSSIEIFASQDMNFAAFLTAIDIDLDYYQLESLDNHISDLVINHHISGDGRLNLLLSGPSDTQVKDGDKMLTITFNTELEPYHLDKINFVNADSEIAFEDGTSSEISFRFHTEYPRMVLKQNVPNPWVNSTTFEVIIPQNDEAVMSIRDVSGKVLMKRSVLLTKGLNNLVVRDADLSSVGGMYFFEIATSYGVESKKMMLLAH